MGENNKFLRLVIQIPPETHSLLRKKAFESKKSMAKIIRDILKKYLTS